MDSPNTPCTLSSHQAIMKCPWQWRQPFLAEKLESRKRKAGDGYFYDPVDPNFVDHLLPGYAKKLCTDLLEVDEKEKIQREIERLMLKKEEEHDEFVASAAMIYDSLLFLNDEAGVSARTASPTSSHVPQHGDGEGEASTENQALIDSILLMSKTVEEASHTSSLLASPLSESASSDEEDLDASSSDESSPDDFSLDDSSMSSPVPDAVQSPSLELMSDNLQESLLSVDDDDLLDFGCNSTSQDDDQ